MPETALSAEFLISLTSAIIRAAIDIHRALGPGLLEKAYLLCLLHDLRQAGLSVESHVRLPLVYKEVRIDPSYIADVIVNRAVLVEVKAVDAVAPIHLRQLSTYLRLGNVRVGLLLNSAAARMTEGIHRSANNFPDR